MTSNNTQRLRALGLTLLGIVIGSVLATSGATHSTPGTALEADFWYDTSDPALILGEAPFAAVVIVDGVARIDTKSGRTVFDLTVKRNLRGVLPETFKASQLGFVDADAARVLDGFPLLETGATYLVALTTPGTDDPQDALVILTGPHGGNAVRATNLNDRQASRFLAAVGRSRSPYVDSSARNEVSESIARWAARNAGFSPAPISGP